MMGTNMVLAVGGLGLFFYSLRKIYSLVNELSIESIKRRIEVIVCRPQLCVMSGLSLTMMLQLSSVIIVVAMALLSRSAITLEQGALLMLGSAIGTTLKAWLSFNISLYVAAALISISGIGIVVNSSVNRLKILEITLAIGFAVFGIELLTKSLSPMLELPLFQSWLGEIDGSTFTGTIAAAFFGSLSAMVFQSGTSVVILTVAIASKGILTLEAASAIILGANVGATSTDLILSIGQSIGAKRLAFMHFAAKSMGVVIALLFFRSFLSLLFFALPKGTVSVGMHLAIVDTGFNVMNCISWWIFLPFLARISRSAFSDSYDSEFWLSSLGVQKLLARIPDRAIDEAQGELLEIVRGLSEVSNNRLKFMSEKGLRGGNDVTFKSLRAKIEALAKRLANVETVVARVAPQCNESSAVQERMYLMLERIGRLNRVIDVLSDMAYVFEEHYLDLEGVSPIGKKAVVDLITNINECWEQFYLDSTGGVDAVSCQQILADGENIYQLFYEGSNYRNGLKTQKLYGVLKALTKELGKSAGSPTPAKSRRLNATTVLKASESVATLVPMKLIYAESPSDLPGGGSS